MIGFYKQLLYNIHGDKMTNIYDLKLQELEDFFTNNNEKKFRATQVFDWIYKKKVATFDEMSNLSKTVIDLLNNNFEIKTLEKVIESRSVDGTIKFLYGLKDGNLIETVLMNHDYGYSICVTSQVGCNMGCRFCASGILK